MTDVEMKESSAVVPEPKKAEDEPSDNFYGKPETYLTYRAKKMSCAPRKSFNRTWLQIVLYINQRIQKAPQAFHSCWCCPCG